MVCVSLNNQWFISYDPDMCQCVLCAFTIPLISLNHSIRISHYLYHLSLYNKRLF